MKSFNIEFHCLKWFLTPLQMKKEPENKMLHPRANSSFRPW